MRSEAEISNLKVQELKAELKARGLDINGKKEVLVSRLIQAIEQEDDEAPRGETEGNEEDAAASDINVDGSNEAFVAETVQDNKETALLEAKPTSESKELEHQELDDDIPLDYDGSEPGEVGLLSDDNREKISSIERSPEQTALEGSENAAKCMDLALESKSPPQNSSVQEESVPTEDQPKHQRVNFIEFSKKHEGSQLEKGPEADDKIKARASRFGVTVSEIKNEKRQRERNSEERREAPKYKMLDDQKPVKKSKTEVSNSANGVKSPVVSDPEFEAKCKARAERFKNG